MTAPIVRYSEAPELVFAYPTCGACCVEVECPDSDGWVCPMCGTTWGMNDYEQQGTLYEERAGEQPDAPLVSHSEGMLIAMREERRQQDARRDELLAEARRVARA